MINKEKFVDSVLNKYFTSGDFNGLSVHHILKMFNTELDELKVFLLELIKTKKANVWFIDFYQNTHIKAFSWITDEQQIELLQKNKLTEHCCVYPSKEILNKDERIYSYIDRPYTFEIAKGAGQLDFKSFDLSVLEFYRNDPRYFYQSDDVNGSICVEDEYYKSKKFADSDKVLLKSFGFSYSKNFDRFVAVFLRYLSKLSPEHQYLWKAKEIKEEFKIHPDYYRSNLLGDWGTKISIFDAFTEELDVINKMCSKIDRENLFRKSYYNNRPKEFGFLIRPTLYDFNNFVLLLDKMLSDNINKKFFHDVESENEIQRADGKIVTSQKGTIVLLEEWIKSKYRASDQKPIDDMFSTLRHVRKLRQKPAHSIDENIFDQDYFKKQRKLILDAYLAVKTIRLIFSDHPSIRKNPPEMSSFIREGNIWDI